MTVTTAARSQVPGGRGVAIRLGIFYAAIFLLLGVYMPYLPVWLAWRGLSPVEIGIVTAIPMFARIIATPAIGFVADRRGDHRETILIGSWVTLVSAAVLSVSTGFWPILIAVAVFQIVNQSLLPLTEAKTLHAIRAYRLDYGRIRLWGSISFIAANLIGGAVLAGFAARGIMIFVVCAVALAVVCAHVLPVDVEASTDIKPGARRIRLQDLGQIVRQRWFIVLMLASGCIQSSHAVFYAFSAIHWRGLGISDGWIGGLWALGVMAEVILFAWSSRLMRWLGPERLVLLGGIAAVVRWGAMVFDPPFWALVGLQFLHAFTFGATFLGTLNILQNSVPPHQAGSAQGLHAALASGVIMGLMTIASGRLYEAFGANSYLAMMTVAAIGVMASMAVLRLAPAARIHPPQS